MTTQYNKLVRDRIPEYITANNKGQPKHRTIRGDERLAALNNKLGEELAEYLDANSTDESIEELADMVEVIHGILHHNGKTFADLEQIRLTKKRERGGFEHGIFLESVTT